MKISDLLKIKNRPTQTIRPNDSVLEAIKKLVDNNIGALPVCDAKDALLGIVSERDLLKVCTQGDKIANFKVEDIMSRDIAIAVPEDELEYAMRMMSQRGIRHLPIMVGPKLYGIISMRDIVETQLEETKVQVRYLSNYISGGYS